MNIIKSSESHSQFVMEQPKKVLLTSISSDAHTWNLIFIQLLLEYHGYDVVNLGACVPDELVLETLHNGSFDAIAVSTVNGHGYIDGVRLIDRIRSDKRVNSIPAVIGGKIGISGKDDVKHINELYSHGFDAVYVDDVNANDFIGYLDNIEAANKIEYREVINGF